MNKQCKQYLYIIVLFVIVSFPTFLFAWDNNFTHPELTKQAIRLLIDYSPLYRELGDFANLDGYGRILDEDNQLSYIDEGSVKEDADWDFGPIVGGWNKYLWGDKQTGDIWVTSYLSHGFNHRDGASWEAWYCNLCDNISTDCHLCDNALQYSDELWTTVRTSGPVAIRNYILPDRGNWYFQAGRLSHLIQDMTSPAHAHADPHNPDGVEHYAETNFAWLNYLSGFRVRQPSTDGLSGYKQNTPRNFIQNLNQ